MAVGFHDLEEWLSEKLRRQSAREPASPGIQRPRRFSLGRLTFGELLEQVRNVPPPRPVEDAEAAPRYGCRVLIRDGESWVLVTAYEHALKLMLAGVEVRVMANSQVMVLSSGTLNGLPQIEVLTDG